MLMKLDLPGDTLFFMRGAICDVLHGKNVWGGVLLPDT
jgi:hypothetical protein